MSEEKKQTSGEDSANPSIKDSSTTEYINDSTSDNPKTESKTSYTNQIQDKSYNIIVTKSKKDPQIRANQISFWGLLINVVLAFFTYLLFTKTIEANNTSTRSLAQAKRANDISDSNRTDDKIKDANQAIADRKRDSLDSIQRGIDHIKDSIIISLTKQSAAAQTKYASTAENYLMLSNQLAKRSDSNYMKSIQLAGNYLDVSKQSLQTVQKNFQVENRPLIFMRNIFMDSFKVDQQTPIVMTIQNFGKSPTLLVMVKREMAFNTVDTLGQFLYPKENNAFINAFMSVNGAFNFDIPSPKWTRGLLDSIDKGQAFVFAYGEATYFDIIKRKFAFYQFCFKLHSNRTFEITPFHNDILESN